MQVELADTYVKGSSAPMEEIYCFAGNPLDRVSQRRQDREWVASLLEDPETRLLPLHDLKPQTRHSSVAALNWQRSRAMAAADRRRRHPDPSRCPR
jgi:hypothetical protein